MLKSVKKKFRLEVALDELARTGPLFFWTLTTADCCDYATISQRWKGVRHWLNEKFDNFRYIQNFELHPLGHGWHIHFVCNHFIDLKTLLPRFRDFGFGRVNVKEVVSLTVGNYLLKHAWKPVKNSNTSNVPRVRLINISKNLCCPLSRFALVGGNTGLVTPDRKSKDDLACQFIAKTYFQPMLCDKRGGAVGVRRFACV